MDLKKFKLLSVLLLAAAVMFLSVNLIRNKNETENMSFSVAEDLSRLYGTQGITLAPETIPLSREKLSVYICPSADGATAQSIAEKISGSLRIAANLTEDGYIFRLENGALAEVSKGFDLHYDISGRGNSDERTAIHKPDADETEKAEALMDKLMGEQGENGDTVCSYVLSSAAKAGSNTQLDFDIYVDGIKLYNKGFSVYLDSKNSILAAGGMCCFSTIEKQSGAPRYDIISVMKAELDRLTGEGKTGLSVESVEQCYVLAVSTDDNTVYFLPGWEIRYSDGTYAAYDAVNCTKH